MTDAPNGDPPVEEPDSQADPRPEEVLREWSGRAGRLLAAAAMRAREEAEDILAEAQAIRRGDYR